MYVAIEYVLAEIALFFLVMKRSEKGANCRKHLHFPEHYPQLNFMRLSSYKNRNNC